mmetsp:Transcript_22189/g.39956  ORF Transcript_22189/g.39956 Transcript_22189/m.39956 type:complete len:267 (-) Transcript_22189:9-809(-)
MSRRARSGTSARAAQEGNLPTSCPHTSKRTVPFSYPALAAAVPGRALAFLASTIHFSSRRAPARNSGPKLPSSRRNCCSAPMRVVLKASVLKPPKRRAHSTSQALDLDAAGAFGGVSKAVPSALLSAAFSRFLDLSAAFCSSAFCWKKANEVRLPVPPLLLLVAPALLLDPPKGGCMGAGGTEGFASSPSESSRRMAEVDSLGALGTGAGAGREALSKMMFTAAARSPPERRRADESTSSPGPTPTTSRSNASCAGGAPMGKFENL